nr:hypothetical protein [Tanacetum cinerariifolium]
MHPNRGKIAELDADKDVTLVDVDTVVEIDADIQGRMEEDVIVFKEITAAKPEPNVFDDEEVTMTMAQTLKKMKAKKARIIDEQLAKKLEDEEIEQAVAREKQEKNDFKRAQELQQQKYQSLKRKPIFVAQARKNMIVYLKNMDGHKIAHFKEPAKKKGAEQKLLQESLKKLRAEVEASGSHTTQEDTPTDDAKKMSEEDVMNMLQIIPVAEVGGITQAYRSVEDMLKDFDREDLDTLWRLTKEKFSTAMPTEDKEKALLIELKRLHDIFMFPEKDYPLTDVVLLQMLSRKLQVDEDCEMDRDLVMKIFMEANKPKSKRSLDRSSK